MAEAYRVLEVKMKLLAKKKDSLKHWKVTAESSQAERLNAAEALAQISNRLESQTQELSDLTLELRESRDVLWTVQLV